MKKRSVLLKKHNKPGTAEFGAPLKLKNSKRSSKRQIFSSIGPKKPKGGPNRRAGRENLILRQKIFILKNLNAENSKRGTLWAFQHPFCRKISKIQGDIQEFSKKDSQSRKKIDQGDLLVSPGIVCYAIIVQVC